MKTSLRTLLFFGAAASVAAGCSSKFCEDYYRDVEPGTDCDNLGGAGSQSTSSSGSMSTSASTTQSSSSTGVNPTCIPSDPTWSPSADCGVFVKSGETGDGTPESPFGTVIEAVATGRHVYIAEGTYEGAVSLPSGMHVYGGLKGDWTFDAATRPIITAVADAIPVRLLAGTSGTEVHHIKVEAKNAEAQGGSSIAMLIEDVPSVLDNLDLVAGDGKQGASSITPDDDIGPSDPADAAIKGNDGKPADTSTVDMALAGGLPKQNDLCSTSVGGKGGDGGIISAGVQDAAAGGTGAVLPAGCTGNCGNAGVGETSVNTACMAGVQGHNGEPGDNGVAPSALGNLTIAGFIAPSPGDGTDGTPGQGGGGGGGARGKDTATVTRGASGGSGGAGGCGGKGAPGGKSGGSSIALILLSNTPILTTVTLTLGSAANGGTGANGQSGVTGGLGGLRGAGNDTNNACSGGEGGQGGDGGHGAGGRGGHAIGIAFNGEAPAGGFTVLVPGTAGEGGMSSGNAGLPGERADVLDFVP